MLAHNKQFLIHVRLLSQDTSLSRQLPPGIKVHITDSLCLSLSLFHTHFILVHHISGEKKKKLEIWLKHNHGGNNLFFCIYRLIVSSLQHQNWNFSALCVYLHKWYLHHLISYILYDISENYSVRFSIFAIF